MRKQHIDIRGCRPWKGMMRIHEKIQIGHHPHRLGRNRAATPAKLGVFAAGACSDAACGFEAGLRAEN
jgi:hypothetical protein